jgi:Type IV pilin-like G and H, putative
MIPFYLFRLHHITVIGLLLYSVNFLSGCAKKAKPTPEQSNAALIGEWVSYQGIRENVRMIVKPNGESWMIDRQGIASKAKIWTNSQSQPMHMDLISPTDSWMTTYEFSDYDTIYILPLQAGLKQVRHNVSTETGIKFTRVSNKTDLDPSNRVAPEKPTIAERQESEASLYLNTLSFAQRDYSNAKQIFARKLSEMNPGFSDDFVGYNYQVLPWGNDKTLITAEPSDANMNSFTALVTKNMVEKCRSLQPSTTAPQFMDTGNGQFSCGPGSEISNK